MRALAEPMSTLKKIAEWPEEDGARLRGPAAGGLPFGVSLLDLRPHADDRGVFTELHRDEWQTGPRPVQWNAVRSNANVFRGVHVHRIHADELVVLDGVMLLGLHDMRRDSPTHGLSVIVELRGDAPRSAGIPPGVAHGFFFPVPSLHVYAVSRYFDPEDDLACRFDSPELNLDWPMTTPRLSKRDAEAGTYGEAVARLMATDGQQATRPGR